MICKGLYVLVIVKEFGFNSWKNNNTNDTYENINSIMENDIIN